MTWKGHLKWALKLKTFRCFTCRGKSGESSKTLSFPHLCKSKPIQRGGIKDKKGKSLTNRNKFQNHSAKSPENQGGVSREANMFSYAKNKKNSALSIRLLTVWLTCTSRKHTASLKDMNLSFVYETPTSTHIHTDGYKRTA